MIRVQCVRLFRLIKDYQKGHSHFVYGFDIFPHFVNSHIRISSARGIFITKICLYNFDPIKPHFYIVKLGFTGVFIIFLISAQKHRLWVLVRTASPRRF